MESTQAIGTTAGLVAVIEEAIEETFPMKVNDNTHVYAYANVVTVTVLGSLEVKGSCDYFNADSTEKEIWDRIRKIGVAALDF